MCMLFASSGFCARYKLVWRSHMCMLLYITHTSHSLYVYVYMSFIWHNKIKYAPLPSN
jgi:hypothetical protein